MKKFTILFIACSAILSACKKADKPLEKPVLVFKTLSHDHVVNGSPKDTAIISLRYSIAISGIGADTAPVSVYLKDSRDQTVNRISFPDGLSGYVPQDEVNISGLITLKLAAASFLVLRPDRPNGDTLQYEIHIEDKNGVKSNTVSTPNIYILP